MHPVQRTGPWISLPLSHRLGSVSRDTTASPELGGCHTLVPFSETPRRDSSHQPHSELLSA